MPTHVVRLPFPLHPLLAEANRPARRRRVLLVVVTASAVVAGVTFALRFPNAVAPPQAGSPAVLATFRSPEVSFRYPSAWQRHRGCAFTLTSGGAGRLHGARRRRTRPP